jgi:hypothetical protein
MTECVILWRNTQNDAVGFISNSEGDIEVFANRDEAIALALDHPLLRAFPYQIVELEEL